MIVLPFFCFAKSKKLRYAIFSFFVQLGAYGKKVTIGIFILGFLWGLFCALLGRCIGPEPPLDNLFGKVYGSYFHLLPVDGFGGLFALIFHGIIFVIALKILIKISNELVHQTENRSADFSR
jgi:hypothetical protein